MILPCYPELGLHSLQLLCQNWSQMSCDQTGSLPSGTCREKENHNSSAHTKLADNQGKPLLSTVIFLRPALLCRGAFKAGDSEPWKLQYLLTYLLLTSVLLNCTTVQLLYQQNQTNFTTAPLLLIFHVKRFTSVLLNCTTVQLLYQQNQTNFTTAPLLLIFHVPLPSSCLEPGPQFQIWT